MSEIREILEYVKNLDAFGVLALLFILHRYGILDKIPKSKYRTGNGNGNIHEFMGEMRSDIKHIVEKVNDTNSKIDKIRKGVVQLFSRCQKNHPGDDEFTIV